MAAGCCLERPPRSPLTVPGAVSSPLLGGALALLPTSIDGAGRRRPSLLEAGERPLHLSFTPLPRTGDLDGSQAALSKSPTALHYEVAAWRGTQEVEVIQGLSSPGGSGVHDEREYTKWLINITVSVYLIRKKRS